MRPYWFWLFGSPVAFLLVLGLPIAWLALRALARGEALAIAIFAVIAIAAVLRLHEGRDRADLAVPRAVRVPRRGDRARAAAAAARGARRAGRALRAGLRDRLVTDLGGHAGRKLLVCGSSSSSPSRWPAAPSRGTAERPSRPRDLRPADPPRRRPRGHAAHVPGRVAGHDRLPARAGHRRAGRRPVRVGHSRAPKSGEVGRDFLVRYGRRREHVPNALRVRVRPLDASRSTTTPPATRPP